MLGLGSTLSEGVLAASSCDPYYPWHWLLRRSPGTHSLVPSWGEEKIECGVRNAKLLPSMGLPSCLNFLQQSLW